MTKKLSAITIDVESDWGGRSSATATGARGCEEGLSKILTALNKHDLQATFFVSAKLAEALPHIVPSLMAEGHEVASHGYDHIDYSALTKSHLRYQLEKSKDILEQQCGAKVTGFRAPQFRIPNGLFECLSQAGYEYDSSIVLGTLAGRYDNGIEAIDAATQFGLREIPLRVLPILKIPVGVLWLSTIGVFASTQLMKMESRGQKYASLGYIFYCHPFDFIDVKADASNKSMLLRLWYGWRPRPVLSTFNDMIEFLKHRYRIVRLDSTAVKSIYRSSIYYE